MSDSPTPKPRRSRLQFSLRLLLLAFTAFAIGFPIWYRWPYEETHYGYASSDTTQPPVMTIVTTWQRTWGGGRVKSGREVEVLVQGKGGQIKTIRHYEGGLLHGKFEVYRGEQLIQAGQYERGQREGQWAEYDAKGKLIWTPHWHADRLDGPVEFAAPGLRRGESERMVRFVFSKDRLVDTQGQPLRNRLLEQLESGGISDTRMSAELQEPLLMPFDFVETPIKDVVEYLQDSLGMPVVLDRWRVSNYDLPVTLNVRGLDLCSALTILAGMHGMAFENRHGVLFLTTPEHASDPRDPTGVADIRPPPDSSLALAWNEPYAQPVAAMPIHQALPTFGQPLAVSFDLAALPPKMPPDISMGVTSHLQGLPFKHILALLLDEFGLRCEARGGDTIVILPPKAP